MGCITTMVSISMISCIMLSVLKYEVEVNDIIHKIDLNCLLKFNYYVNFKETQHKMIICLSLFLHIGWSKKATSIDMDIHSVHLKKSNVKIVSVKNIIIH